MTALNTAQMLWLEDILFLAIATLFLVIVGWSWRSRPPYTLPTPLPGWFRFWFGTVQVLAILPPLVALVWGIWQPYDAVLPVFASYFLMLGLQILAEFLTLRRYRSVVWVMVPYLYLPYRWWQLYEGFTLIGGDTELVWVRAILIGEIVLWVGNYLLDLAQLPRLLYWKSQT
jgi:hypothetical protein